MCNSILSYNFDKRLQFTFRFVLMNCSIDKNLRNKVCSKELFDLNRLCFWNSIEDEWENTWFLIDKNENTEHLSTTLPSCSSLEHDGWENHGENAWMKNDRQYEWQNYNW